jgi:hypothetical protein
MMELLKLDAKSVITLVEIALRILLIVLHVLTLIDLKLPIVYVMMGGMKLGLILSANNVHILVRPVLKVDQPVYHVLLLLLKEKQIPYVNV